MFAFVTLLAFAIPFLVRAIVSPTEPGPGNSYNEGSSCFISWDGDTNSTTAWKNMTIELMAGSNLDMVHLTTVATNLDGTVSGNFNYICPAVTPNAPIYFYQFSSPTAANKTWTTRFAIASTTGQVTAPANMLQPESNQNIPWGNGSLVDPSTAVAAPSFDASNSPALPSSTSVLIATSSTTGAASSISIITNTVTSSSSVPSSTNSASATSQSTSGASGAMIGFDVRVLGAVAAATLALSCVW